MDTKQNTFAFTVVRHSCGRLAEKVCTHRCLATFLGFFVLDIKLLDTKIRVFLFCYPMVSLSFPIHCTLFRFHMSLFQTVQSVTTTQLPKVEARAEGERESSQHGV